MSFEPAPTNDHKRKPTEAPEPVVSHSDTVDESRPRDWRPRRVSPEAVSNATSTYASMATGTPEQMIHAMPIGSVERIGKLVQDLSSQDGDVVEDSLTTLGRCVFDSGMGSQILLQDIVAVGGCYAFVQLAKTFIEKARMEIPNCDQVTELEGAMLILRKVLRIMARLTFGNFVSSNLISSIGGAELVVKVMQTFPNCELLQLAACHLLYNLTSNDFAGMMRASGAPGAIKALLTSVKSYPENKYIFLYGCGALGNMCVGSFERTKQLIDLGGITKWPDDPEARAVAKFLLREMAGAIHHLLNTY